MAALPRVGGAANPTTMENPGVNQLDQLCKGPVWDGNLISKTERDNLAKAKYVARAAGWNFLTANGVKLAIALGILKT